MATTGDINNNIEKLKKELRLLRYPVEADLKSIIEGQPFAFLPLINFALLQYSEEVANFLKKNDYILQQKTDA